MIQNTNTNTNTNKIQIQTLNIHLLKFLLSIAHKQWPQFRSSKLGRSREVGGKCWRKTALKCAAVNARRIVNAGVTFYCPGFFSGLQPAAGGV